MRSRALAAALLLAGGCRGRAAEGDAGPAATTISTAALSRDGGAHENGSRAALTAIAREAAEQGIARLSAWKGAADRLRADHPEYLGLRRAVALGAPFFRRRAVVASEVLLGPERSSDEAGGAMLALDRAIEAGDEAAVRAAAGEVERALLLTREEITRNRVPPDAAAAALSAAAFELGALILESTAGAPAGRAAVLADLRGTLDLIRRGAEALADAPRELAAVRAEIDPIAARFDAATTALDLHDRASLVLATGRLGAALRRLAASNGLETRLPYPPRIAVRGGALDEPVSALTLPARRAPRPGAPPDPPDLAALGEKLFFDRRLSKNDARACAFCHDPTRGFADGRPTAASLAGTPLRHTPTLLYTSLHAVQLWDGRTVTAEDQALGVIHSHAEMGLIPGELVDKLRAVPEYTAAFAALPGGLTAANVGRALGAFEAARLAPADAPIDRFARGDEAALSADARAGLDVFAGKGRCARCHVPPFFGGSRPRDFATPVFAVLGVPTRPSSRALDPDRGRGAVTGLPLDERAFKTPTVRDVARTSPYFHNGAYGSLDEVIDFYDRGGGRGLGLAVENQDPDVRRLGLSADERRALRAFLESALRDATPPEKLVGALDARPRGGVERP